MIPKDLTGLVMQDYGVPNSRLTVIGKDIDDKWLCKCQCGNLISVKRANLIRKDTKGTRSCGCMRQEVKDKFAKLHYHNLTNQRFGKLVVMNPNGSDKNGYTYWQCQCDCGQVCMVSARDLLDGSTQSCGCLKSKGELIIAQWLTENKFSFEREYSFTDLIQIRPLRFDFKINLKNSFILLEYQGEQHYDVTNAWYTEEGCIRDQMKRDYCKNKNILLYEINNKNEAEIISQLKLIFEGRDDLSD